MAAPLIASLYDRKPLDSAEAVRESIHDRVRAKRQPWSATQKQLGYMNGLLAKCFGTGDAGTVARHQFLEQMFGTSSSKALNMGEASAVIDWVKDPDGDGPHPAAVAEGWTILKAWGEEHGQEKLL